MNNRFSVWQKKLIIKKTTDISEALRLDHHRLWLELRLRISFSFFQQLIRLRTFLRYLTLFRLLMGETIKYIMPRSMDCTQHFMISTHYSGILSFLCSFTCKYTLIVLLFTNYILHLFLMGKQNSTRFLLFLTSTWCRCLFLQFLRNNKNK